MNTYHIYAYKHYWVKDDPMPMPYRKDERDYIIKAKTEKAAIKKAEKEYGSGQRIDSTGKYVNNSDGSWTLMGVTKVIVD